MKYFYVYKYVLVCWFGILINLSRNWLYKLDFFLRRCLAITKIMYIPNIGLHHWFWGGEIIRVPLYTGVPVIVLTHFEIQYKISENRFRLVQRGSNQSGLLGGHDGIMLAPRAKGLWFDPRWTKSNRLVSTAS